MGVILSFLIVKEIPDEFKDLAKNFAEKGL